MDFISKVEKYLESKKILNEEKQKSSLAIVKEVFDNDKDVYPDQISKVDKGIVIRKGFFYRHGGDSNKWKDQVTGALDRAGIKYTVVDSGEVYKNFKGGASVANQSHWYVIVKLTNEDGKVLNESDDRNSHKITITIETDNESFDNDEIQEFVNILTGLISDTKKESSFSSQNFPLKDSNGNTVGKVEIEKV